MEKEQIKEKGNGKATERKLKKLFTEKERRSMLEWQEKEGRQHGVLEAKGANIFAFLEAEGATWTINIS